MSRLLTGLGLLVLLLAVLAAAAGYFAYAKTPARAGTLELARLEGAVSVAWAEEGGVVLEGAHAADLAAALGYVHGVDDGWALALWRQAAVGSLAEWFGEDYVGFDRHARTLGLRALAYHTYVGLPDSTRALLDAYAAGVNRALRDPAVAQRDEFVLLRVAPGRFEPWHALAVERLLAWAGTPPLRLTGAAARDSGLVRFARTDSLYRAFLRLGGAGRSRAWAAPVDSTEAGGAGTAFVQQHAYGASALPLVREVTLRRAGRSTTVASVPGTLVFPGGVGEARAWSVFLTSPAALDSAGTALPPLDYDRLVDRAGRETLIAVRRGQEGLFFEAEVPRTPPPARADTLTADTLATAPPAADTTAAPLPEGPPPSWALRWPGFALGTDVGAWWALVEGGAPAFRLFRGDGLAMTREGAAEVLGSPAVQQPLPGGVFVSADSLARFAAERLAGLLGGTDTLGVPLTPAALTADAYSPWAAARLPVLLGALGDRDALPADLKDPYAFLLSWNAHYDPDAIGASIFETWLLAHEEELGAPPTAGDSLNGVLLQQTLRLAVAILRTRHGGRPSAWRWENVQPGTRYFPVWSGSGGPGGPAGRRYAPVTPGVGGHPTALHLGPSLVFSRWPAPAVWTAWTSTAGWDALTVRHPVVETDAFLARARATRDPGAPFRVRRDAPLTRPLTLRPPRD